MSLHAVKGQETALRMLTGASARDRLATSYLFAGEDGIGKKLTAVNFFKALNCREPVDRSGYADACDECPSCRKTDAGTHPDFLLIEPENGIIRVEQIRKLDEMFSFRAFEGGIKAVVVDEAETMNASAANAFLKTLEEPPTGSLIVLVSSRPDWLPATIRSRCSRVNFRPLSPAVCQEVIGAGQDAPLLARLSMGRPGLALREDLLRERQRFMVSLGKMFSSEGKPSWEDRRDIERWLDMALLILRDMAVMKITGKVEALLNADMADKLMAMSAGATPEVIIECYGKLRRLQGELIFNLNKGITWNYASTVLGELNIRV